MEAVAKLRNLFISPRKVRLVVDLIRGMKANEALVRLRHEPKKCAIHVEKLLLSAIANWQAKNEDQDIEKTTLFIKEVRVDGGRMLKRIKPAPQGRAHRIRKRSNHITLVVDGVERVTPPVKKTEKKNSTQQEKKTADGAKS